MTNGKPMIAGLLFTVLTQITASAEPAPRAISAALNVSPLRLELSQGQQSTSLMLRNESRSPTPVQLRVFAWSQDATGEHYLPTTDFVISPSIAQIDPGLTQTFHVVGATAPLAGKEAAYRVAIDQLPQSDKHVAGAIQTRLRMTVPLFRGSDGASPGELHFVIKDGHLLIGNRGGRSVKLYGLTMLQGAAAVAIPKERFPHYVLGSAVMRVALPPGFRCNGQEIHVAGAVDQKNFDAVAQQDCP